MLANTFQFRRPRSSDFRPLLILALLLVSVCSGCRWPHMFRRYASEPTPIAFAALPSRDEALAAINANGARIQSLQTQGATVSVPGAPSIGAEIALDKPKSFRFRAGTTLLGPELDMGSNDSLFWFWAARAPEPSVFYARHDQFATSRARQMLPIEPSWLIQALGVVEVDPATILDGPKAAGKDRVEVRTSLSTSAGQFTRLIHLDSRYAWILEQHLYDERGQLVASARSSEHEYYPLDGVSLPRQIDVQIPQGQMQFQLTVDRWTINQPPLEGPALFELPRAQLASHPFVDMADPSFVPPGGQVSSAPQTGAAAGSEAKQAELSERYRGFNAWR